MGKNTDRETRLKWVLEQGTGWDAYRCAQNVPGADIEALQQVVLERGDAQDAYLFARDIDGADKQILRDRLVALYALGSDDDYLSIFDAEFGRVSATQTREMECITPDIMPSDPRIHGDYQAILGAIRVERDEHGQAAAIHVGSHIFSATGKQAPLFTCIEDPSNDVIGDVFKSDQGLELLADSSLQVLYLGFDAGQLSQNSVLKRVLESNMRKQPATRNSSMQSVLDGDLLARQQTVLDGGDGWAAYEFARDVTGADISALQQVVLDHGFGYEAYLFAKDVRGADIHALQQVVIDRGDGGDAYLFARDISGSDTKGLQQVVLERGVAFDAYQFAKDIEGSDIVQLQKCVLRTSTGYVSYKFARDIPGADIDALQQNVLEHGLCVYAYQFAKDINGADLPKILERLTSLHATGEDEGYLDRFHQNENIQKAMRCGHRTGLTPK